MIVNIYQYGKKIGFKESGSNVTFPVHQDDWVLVNENVELDSTKIYDEAVPTNVLSGITQKGYFIVELRSIA